MKSIRIKIDERKAIRAIYKYKDGQRLVAYAPILDIEAAKAALPRSHAHFAGFNELGIYVGGRFGEVPRRGDYWMTNRHNCRPATIHEAAFGRLADGGLDMVKVEGIIDPEPAELILDASPMFHRCVQRIIERFAK